MKQNSVVIASSQCYLELEVFPHLLEDEGDDDAICVHLHEAEKEDDVDRKVGVDEPFHFMRSNIIEGRGAGGGGGELGVGRGKGKEITSKEGWREGNIKGKTVGG